MLEKRQTTKITKDALADLQRISELTGEKQYAVLTRLLKQERARIESKYGKSKG